LHKKRNGHQIEKAAHKWEKIFSSYKSDKGSITGIYREFKKLNSLKINDPMKKWTNELNRAFSKQKVQMAKNHMKKCSTSLAIKEMQITTTLRFHLSLLEWLQSRTQTTTNAGGNAYSSEKH
jgi:hypothetical protein